MTHICAYHKKNGATKTILSFKTFFLIWIIHRNIMPNNSKPILLQACDKVQWYVRIFYIFQSEKGWDLDITQGQWENGRLRCSIYQYHGTAQFQPASFGGQGGPGDIRLPWLGHLCHCKRPQAEPTARLTAYVSFFQGTWKNYILQRGRYCNITNSSNKAHLKLAIDTEEINSPELRYLPPYFNSYGLPPTQADPFEMNTVEVNRSEST